MAKGTAECQAWLPGLALLPPLSWKNHTSLVNPVGVGEERQARQYPAGYGLASWLQGRTSSQVKLQSSASGWILEPRTFWSPKS